MPGWTSYYVGEHKTEYSTCEYRKYNCSFTFLVGNTLAKHYKAGDLVVFHEMDISEVPPHKYSNQLWAFRSSVPQHRLATSAENWNNLFNYTCDFQENATIKTYRFSVGRNMDYVFRNYFADKLGNIGVLKMKPSAVWIVPDCNVDISSASLEYAEELGHWIDITLLMPSGPCSWQWHSAFHSFDSINSEELHSVMYYPFHLSFENSFLVKLYNEEISGPNCR